MSPGLLAAAAGGVAADAPADFILGTTKPNSTNTGLVSPTTSTDNSTNVTLTAGSDVDGVLFNGNVLFGADDIHMYNCRIRGKTTTTGQAITRNTTSGITGIHLERCQLDNRWFPSTDGTDGAHAGIQGASMTLTRCDISGACDGVMLIAPGNVSLLGNYIHDHWFFSPNADHLTDGNHSDGVQGTGASMTNILIDGNTIEGLLDNDLPNSQAGIEPTYSGSTLISGNSWYDDYFSLWNGIYAFPPWGTSAILFGRSGAATLSNLTITRNWLDGGGFACINLNNGYTNATTSAISITNNRVGANTRDKTGGRSYLLICSSSLTTDLTLTGNVNENDGTPNNSRRNG